MRTGSLQALVVAALFTAMLPALPLAPLEAQDRTVSGTVTDSAGGQPLENVRVAVRGTALGTVTGANGRFVITGVPAGAVTLTVRRIGYRAAEQEVAPGQTEVEVALVRDLLQLEEVVVTGQATAVERRNLANAVATVSGEEVARVSSQSVEHALQGRVPGAVISTNSGAPGGGVQVRLRGVTSINATAEPLYIVDGVMVSNVAIPSNQNAVTQAAGGSNPSLTQDAQVNRIADLAPSDIENIEVLKGASASAIYGSRASNGVVIITTKRGARGAPRFSLTQRLGQYRLSNTLGSRRFETEAEAVAAFGASAATYYEDGRVFDQERLLAGNTPYSYETVFDMGGGTDNTQYYVAAQWKDDGGVIANTGFERQSLRANINQRFGQRLEANVNAAVMRTLAQRGLTNNDNASVSFWMVFPFTPSFVDLRRRDDGTFPDNPFVASNPLQTAALMRNDENVWRYIAAGSLQFVAVQSRNHSLRFRGAAGADYFTQENSLFFPPELQFEGDDGEPGTALLGNGLNLNYNLSPSVVYAFTPDGGAFTATTSLGMMYSFRDLRVSRIVSRNLIGGLDIVAAGTNIQVGEQRQRIFDRGFFVQEEVLLLDERLLLTAGVSVDQSSANGDDDELFVYPKTSVSYRVPFTVTGVDELKLRAAYGESGNQPLYGQKFTPLTATQNINGLPALVVQGTVGDPDLRPERQRELEGGVDLTALDGRGTLELTFFRKNISDLLLQRTLAPSSGFATAIFNGGKMRTSGTEIALGVVPVQSADLQWIFRTTFFKTNSKITALPVPTFRAGGFGTALGAYQIEVGASPTQIVGNDSLPDGSTIVRKIGEATPDFTMSFSSDVQWGAFSLTALVDWQQGGSVINLTKFLYDLGGNTADYDRPITVGGVETTAGAHRLAVFGKQTGVYVEDATFAKVREISLSYDIPPPMLSGLGGGVRTMRLSVSGRNLFTFTDYTGLDPEVSNFGNQQIARNIDVAPFPPSRSFWFSVQVGF